jgi:hypothetical protein
MIIQKTNPHFAAEPGMVRGQRGVVQAPILQIVRVPLPRWQVVRELHPMPLGLVVPKHGGNPLPYIIESRDEVITSSIVVLLFFANVPE